VTQSNTSMLRSGPGTLPSFIAIPIVIILILAFILLGFPWDSLARRVAAEISAASGSTVSIENLAPALTARGPVLRARDVVIEHPAVDRVRLLELEIAVRWSTSWFMGEPALRIWADTELGLIDGILGLGDTSSFIGRVSQVELSRLPLRLDASGLRISGRLDADADVALDPNGTLSGRVAFLSPSLVVESNGLPMAIPFSRAEGVIVILDSGATQIESVMLEGELLEGRLSGEIGLVHHSQAPPIDLEAEFRIINPMLRQLAPGVGIPMSPNGEISVRVRGTLDAPEIESQSTRHSRKTGTAKPLPRRRR
jgi:type II secretion system protein N